ncbi:5'-3' exonuclease PLD3-like [Dermacentor variabilis]|uniref:5'-3' exonuclease PLD3-like n=1 Tax=Dermacentor variabilis TaxID=34621 RepID=UPI003F5B3453
MPVSSWLKVCHLLVLCVTPAFRGSLAAVSDSAKSGFDDQDTCTYTVVETIPEGLNFSSECPEHLSTFDAWRALINMSTSEIKIASFYWTLLYNLSAYPSSSLGAQIYRDLLHAGVNRSIDIKITQNVPSRKFPNIDSQLLEGKGAAKVRNLNLTRLGHNGVLHSKFWAVDGRHAYIGSANMDWRSLAQVKEVGVLMKNCRRIVNDLDKIFEVYWEMSDEDATLPIKWTANLSTSIKSSIPAHLDLNGTSTLTYISSAPPYFTAPGRTEDIDAIVDVISKAKQFVYVAVMNYLPVDYYSKPKRYWAVIDDALRRAAIENGVRVRLLVSKWKKTKPLTWNFLESLASLNSSGISIEVKAIVIPAFTEEQRKTPYARVNHQKMMVTDTTAYIGTSNWEPNYFIETTGVGLVINQNSSDSIRGELKAIFERDWNSNFTYYVRPGNKRKRS